MSARRPRPPDDVYFPVVPMLDMAFQLLAFFVMTFSPPTGESRLDLDLPTAPVALPAGPTGRAQPPEVVGLETDLLIEADAGPDGRLRALRLAGEPVPSPDRLADRLRRYRAVLGRRPVRVTLAADDRLRYQDAASLVGACASAGVAALKLAAPAPADPEPAR